MEIVNHEYIPLTLSWRVISLTSCILSFVPVSRNIYLRFSRNSEAFALEFLEKHKEMFPRYYMHSDVCSRFNSTLLCVTRHLQKSIKTCFMFALKEFIRENAGQMVVYNTLNFPINVFSRKTDEPCNYHGKSSFTMENMVP